MLCEFGRRRVLGVVLDVAEREPDVPLDKLKPLSAVVDSEPVVPEELLDFLLELSRYYLCPIGEVMQLALPAVERSAAENLELDVALPARSWGGWFRRSGRSRSRAGEKLRGKAPELLAHLREAGRRRSRS